MQFTSGHKYFVGLLVVAIIGYIIYTQYYPSKQEGLTTQYLANSPQYTYTPQQDFIGMACGSAEKKPQDKKDRPQLSTIEMPAPDMGAVTVGVDPAENYANTMAFRLPTYHKLKSRLWESNAMIRGDLPIDPTPVQVSHHTRDWFDLTPGMIPQQYCATVNIEDLSYSTRPQSP